MHACMQSHAAITHQGAGCVMTPLAESEPTTVPHQAFMPNGTVAASVADAVHQVPRPPCQAFLFFILAVLRAAASIDVSCA